MSDQNQQNDSGSEIPYSGSSAKRAVLGTTLQHPLTLYPFALGCLGSLTWLLLEPTTFVAAAALSGLSVGVGSWVVNYFVRGKTFENALLQQILARNQQQKEKLLKTLEEDLRASAKIDGAEDPGKQAYEQFKMVNDTFQTFQKLLAEKLSSTEITYGRYFVTAEQVYLSVLDNLDRVATAFKSIKTINPKYAKERLAAIGEITKPTPAILQEGDALKERLLLREKQIVTVQTLLAYNEKAITKMDGTNTAIAGMETRKGRASTDLDTAMKELEVLSKRASRMQ